ncbi:MAG TPA: hypothetical protein VK593_07745, partial [Edaphobacter sp.]|nr:hypothetical protein [Edaphobacter sp.]
MNQDAEHSNVARERFRTTWGASKALRVFGLASLLAGVLSSSSAPAQTYTPPASAASTEERVRQLAAAVAQAQAQMTAYQTQLLEMQRQLTALQQQLAAEKNGTPAQPAAAPPQPATAAANESSSQGASAASLEEMRERQAIDESQIAIHEQTKVETESKYPLKITGLLLFNAFVNTRQVDNPVDPTYAISGSGSTGLSLRQTVLGIDARGPRLFGATSDADVRVDFFANGSQSNYSANGLLRLRTAHAGLNWNHTRAFVALDRSLISPYTPSSLVAVGDPPLAWSGNLWSWVPQIGVSQQVPLHHSLLKLEAGLVDASNPPNLSGSTSNPPNISSSERSRWPGTNARIAFAKGDNGEGPEFGVGGYFSPHKTNDGTRFNAWAGTLDLRVPIGPHFEFTSNVYRGQALGGLGAGGYIDYVYKYKETSRELYPLDDIGGWAQIKIKPRARIEFNGAYG